MAKLYDTHCHMMNLSHPNLSLMVRRIMKELGIVERIEISLAGLLFGLFGKTVRKLTKVDDRLLNLLAIMETEMGDFILQMEKDLAERLNWNHGPFFANSSEIKRYEKVVLIPLMMDFGTKGYEAADTYYKVRWKAIASQVLDVCLGIKNYYQRKDKASALLETPAEALFEIYPCMGINTKNYDMNTQADGTKGLLYILEKHFDGFQTDDPATRRAKLAARDWRKFDGNIDNVGPYSFIGIKVYPPLGFNPWPTESWETDPAKEMEKVRYLYEFCQNHNIPLTSHCSSGGFLVDDHCTELAHPNKWADVLNEYKDLRLNLAHFGADNEEWRKVIAELMLAYDNVYTDISYRGLDPAYYHRLRNFLARYNPKDRERLMSRIIFGSDFMINLLAIDSYSQYMAYFAHTSSLSLSEKDQLCSRNPEKFLFIG